MEKLSAVPRYYEQLDFKQLWEEFPPAGKYEEGVYRRSADELHALRLQPATTVQGDLWIEQAPHARPLIAAFDRRWDAAAHSLPTVPLGL